MVAAGVMHESDILHVGAAGRLDIMGKKRVRHTPEQIVDKLRQAGELKVEGHDQEEKARRLNVSSVSPTCMAKEV